MANLFDNISSYDKFISQLKFSIQTLETFKEKIDFKTVVHQTRVFMESLKKKDKINTYIIKDDKKDMCSLNNGILKIVEIKIDVDYKIKESEIKELYKLYNLDYKYAYYVSNSRILIISFEFEKWLRDSFKD
jgi:Neuraminidase (sialidase)